MLKKIKPSILTVKFNELDKYEYKVNSDMRVISVNIEEIILAILPCLVFLLKKQKNKNIKGDMVLINRNMYLTTIIPLIIFIAIIPFIIFFFHS